MDNFVPAPQSPPTEHFRGLPELHFNHTDVPTSVAFAWEYDELSPKTLATALSRGCDTDTIKQYIEQFPKPRVSSILELRVEGHRVITYAIDTENAQIIQSLLEYDFDINCRDFDDIPLLAFAIMRSPKVGGNHLEVVRLLLSHGADPLVIPIAMWKDYIKMPVVDGYSGTRGPESERWCVGKYQEVLVKSLNLTTRYYLWRASRLRRYSKRMVQIARSHNMTALLKLPFQIIGQEMTVKLVLETVFAHMAADTAKPLVMAFVGPSGHGKTELAKQMGSLLSIPTTTLDCTQLDTQAALFGSSYGYQGNTTGAPLNNFLVANQGKRCVVFLDEFDKTRQDVWNALLRVMDDGTYRDRRGGYDNHELDCRKVIWILASNYGQDAINTFHTNNFAKSKEEDLDKISITPLQDTLARRFMARFSAAVTGRIDTIAPYFPFSPGEQVVVCRKFLLAMQDEARLPVNVGNQRLIGQANITVYDDGGLCKEICARYYNRELGARSIANGVDALRRQFILSYADTDNLVSDTMNERDPERYAAQRDPRPGSNKEPAIFRR
ncbi:P-loop containing nucleoside triphosphate hydrolase protein [Hypoxylon sp. FL1857]|nr:P-loop containing nucleoside triphosphate hydrolase protein [Hypoxylon sp. FL1857]